MNGTQFLKFLFGEYKNVQRWCELEKKIDLRLGLYGIWG